MPLSRVQVLPGLLDRLCTELQQGALRHFATHQTYSLPHVLMCHRDGAIGSTCALMHFGGNWCD